MDCQDECVSREIRRLLQRKSHFKIEPWVGLSALRLESLSKRRFEVTDGNKKSTFHMPGQRSVPDIQINPL